LETSGLTRDFGKFRAIKDVSLQVEKGVLTSLIGPNGAGKTTFYNCVTGKFPPTSGRVLFKGEDITGLPAHAIQQMGLSRSFQIVNIFQELSVVDNIKAVLIAKEKKNWNFIKLVQKDKALHDEALEIVEKLGLKEKYNSICNELSHGDRRRVDIGLAVASNPEMILLDEPTAGMNPNETIEVMDLINHLRTDTGATFFLTEHDMDVVFSISERIVVLHQGSIIADGKPDDIKADHSVQEVYLGGVL